MRQSTIFVEAITLGYNGDILQAMYGTPPRAATTTGAGGPTSVVKATIADSGHMLVEALGH